MRFKKQSNLHPIDLSGEAASVDIMAAELLPEQLKNVIEEGCYSPKKVFTVGGNRAVLEVDAVVDLHLKRRDDCFWF